MVLVLLCSVSGGSGFARFLFYKQPGNERIMSALRITTPGLTMAMVLQFHSYVAGSEPVPESPPSRDITPKYKTNVTCKGWPGQAGARIYFDCNVGSGVMGQ